MSLSDVMKEKGWTLSLAESCTGGAISAHLVKEAGASSYFQGCLVVYSNAFKEKLLQIPPWLIEKEGAVSAPCASLLCKNLYQLTGTTWTGSITGIAGPSGGSAEKPIGTVFMALSFHGDEPLVQQFLFSGSRQEILDQSQSAFLSFLQKNVYLRQSKLDFYL